MIIHAQERWGSKQRKKEHGGIRTTFDLRYGDMLSIKLGSLPSIDYTFPTGRARITALCWLQDGAGVRTSKQLAPICPPLILAENVRRSQFLILLWSDLTSQT